MYFSNMYLLQPDKHLPERWMVPAGYKLHLQPGAWRPFELRPNNCIGQTLVLIELIVILACMIRNLEIEPGYDEWDAQHSNKGAKLYRSELAYQVEHGVIHPVSSYLHHIKLASTQ
jgi:hypothetical protein